MKLVLASGSPRRAEILAAAGLAFERRPPAGIDEAPRAGEDPRDYVTRLARAKAEAVDAAPDEIVLAADTTVVAAGGQILGKPADAADAARMLRLLSGRAHDVITGICLRGFEATVVDAAMTRVW
ncbi:MAG: Maf family protein, partial [Bryobacteraceae bacterium]